MTATRRQLTFGSLDEVVRDAEHLLAVGYEKAGNWDLAQVCGHLTAWATYPLDGYPPVPPLMRPVVWLFRHTLGPKVARKMVFAADGRMKIGLSTIPASVPLAGGDDAAAVAGMRAATDRAKGFAGRLHPSPVLGPMTRDEWVTLHLAHAAHHLSFLVPRDGSRPAG